jgi:Sortase domain
MQFNPKFNLINKIWSLRYRLYALVVVFLLPALLFSGDINIKNNVPVDIGFRIVNSNILAQQVMREDLDAKPAQNEQKIALKEKPIANTLLVEDGRLAIYDKDGNEITRYFTDSELYKLIYNKTEVKIQVNEPKSDNKSENQTENQIKSIEEVVKKPETAVRKNWLKYDKYKIQTPVLYATLDDLYNKNAKGQFNYNDPINQDPIDAPVQKKLKDGIVHLGSTVQPGEIGNSYIVGHSSNYSFVKSDYNTIFKPLESTSKPGEDFFIYDKDGRELKFCVFEAIKIEDSDAKTAYKDFGNKRIVTLQTSILGWRGGQLLATHRWLTRGELCN